MTQSDIEVSHGAGRRCRREPCYEVREGEGQMEAPHGSHAFREGSERAVVGGFGGVEQPDGKIKKKKK